MKMIAVVVSAVVVLLAAAGTLQAASTIYGVSGLIEVPTDVTVAPGSVSVTAHYISDFDGDGNNITSFGGAVGLIPKLEVAGMAMDSDRPGTDVQGVFSVKYRVLTESVKSPSVTVGVVDIANGLDEFDSRINDPSFFIVIGKNLTSSLDQLSGTLTRPLYGYIGTGSGVYKGVFIGLDYMFAPKLSAIGEFLTDGLRQDTTFNAAVRFNPIGPFVVQAGTYDFNGFYIGGSYNLTTF